jgi:AcrR family transcriptional regulator
MPRKATAPERKRAQRSDGERTRKAILSEASSLATVEGLDGLSISRLAEAVGMSKSGLFAHFGSKEELQLATVDEAKAYFAETVFIPADAAATGLARLNALVDTYLAYIEDRTYPGGCFFASVAVEMATRPGPVLDAVVDLIDDYADRLVRFLEQAQEEGGVASSVDAEEMAFEIHSYLFLANTQFVLSGEPAAIKRARRAIDRRLEAAAA